ncbi:unnamed protein product [Vicia faba]|uniref:Uncharacterized protein n=1 Tax=Vicia faba TaxID=3906 RepID=A0AAV1A9F0_VICFA|nr:unnamed protein product [Vicia faba]
MLKWRHTYPREFSRSSVCEFPLVDLMLILSWIVSSVIDSYIFFVGFSLRMRTRDKDGSIVGQTPDRADAEARDDEAQTSELRDERLPPAGSHWKRMAEQHTQFRASRSWGIRVSTVEEEAEQEVVAERIDEVFPVDTDTATRASTKSSVYTDEGFSEGPSYRSVLTGFADNVAYRIWSVQC